jgi:hypothetical protein
VRLRHPRRHFQVHQNHLRLKSLDKSNGIPSIAGFADDLDVPSQGEKGAQVLSHSFHIVHDKYTDVSHALNIRAEEETRIWRKGEPVIEKKSDFSDPP